MAKDRERIKSLPADQRAEARAKVASLEERDRNKPISDGEKRVAGKRASRERFVATFEDGHTEEHWLVVPPDEERCTKKVRNGPYKGQRCRARALVGVEVCTSHGGSLANVKAAALKRMHAAADVVTQELVRIALEGEDERERVKAAAQLLDRAGLDGKATITVELKPWQEVLEGIAKGAKGKKTKGGK